MRKRWSDFCSVFRFTFVQHIRRKGYRGGTLGGVILCFLLPLVIMAALEYLGDNTQEVSYASANLQVYVVNHSGADLDLDALAGKGGEYFDSLTFLEQGEDIEETYKKAEESADALVMTVDQEDGKYQVTVLEPEAEEKSENAENLSFFLSQEFGAAIGQEAAEVEETEEESMGIQEIMNLLLPYLNCMLLYFLLLFYGQNVGGCVILEKTSKLMDTFLISVKPEDMLAGKVLGTVCAAILQFALWTAGLLGGFAAGAAVVRWINPETDMILVLLIESLSLFSGMFSLGTVLLAVAVVMAGFLLYCALAAIGGAISSKPEDLSNANILFVLALVISFFAVLGSSGFGADIPVWLNWVPFTAVLVVPGQILIGSVNTAAGMGILAVVLAASLIVILLAGKVYSAMALYKGNLLTPGRIVKMMKENRV